MLSKKSFALATLFTGVLATSGVQAQEVSLEQYVSNIVKQAVVSTQQELHYEVQAAVLTASNMFSLQTEPEVLMAKVEITDIDNEQDAVSPDAE